MCVCVSIVYASQTTLKSSINKHCKNVGENVDCVCRALWLLFLLLRSVCFESMPGVLREISVFVIVVYLKVYLHAIYLLVFYLLCVLLAFWTVVVIFALMFTSLCLARTTEPESLRCRTSWLWSLEGKEKSKKNRKHMYACRVWQVIVHETRLRSKDLHFCASFSNFCFPFFMPFGSIFQK